MDPKRNQNVIQGQRWVHNTYAAWLQQLPFWTEEGLKRIILGLENDGIIKSFQGRTNQKTKFYTIDYEKLQEEFGIDLSHNGSTKPSCKNTTDDLQTGKKYRVKSTSLNEVSCKKTTEDFQTGKKYQVKSTSLNEVSCKNNPFNQVKSTRFNIQRNINLFLLLLHKPVVKIWRP
jgi:hypothetical protein